MDVESVLTFLQRYKIIVGALVLLYVYRLIGLWRREQRIQQLGGHAPKLPVWLPLGLDFLYRGITSANRDEQLKFWNDNFMNSGNKNNPYTVEANTGGMRVILTCDPENIKAILATQFGDYGKGEQFNKDWHDFLGDSIFSTDHQKWHDSRQLIRPQFIKDRVSDLATFERHSQQLISLLKEGQETDVKDLFFRYTLDAATEFLLGRSVESLKNGSTQFAESFAEIQRVQSIIARVGPMNWWVPRKAFYRHLETLNNFCAPFIEEALNLSSEELEKRTKSDEGYTFLHAIAAYSKDRKVLRDQVVAVLLAGRDTTACTLSWTFYELGRNPSVVAKLRKEIEATVGFERAPTYADLKSMRYLTHTINETLRIYPVVPYNVRMALKDATLPHGGGPDGNSPIGILKDTPVGYSTHMMQLRPDLYPAPSADFPPVHVFSPERWDKWTPAHWTYIPFNGGPRICVGQQFAITEMAYTIVRVLQNFSKVEGRNFEAPHPEAPSTSMQHLNAIEMAMSTRTRMQSDIVLMPHGEIKCAFFK